MIPVSRFSFFDSGMKGNYPSDSNHRRDKNWWVFLKKQLTVNVRRNKQRDVPKSNLFSKKQEEVTVPLEFFFVNPRTPTKGDLADSENNVNSFTVNR